MIAGIRRPLASILFATLFGLTVAAVCGAEPIVIVEGGRSDYRIVISARASAATRHAAEELRRFLKEASGAELPVVTDAEPASEREILIGDSARLQSLSIAVDFPALGEEGFVHRTLGRRLLIAGRTGRADLYGVYEFLEDRLGCRWFTPSVSRIPKTARVAVDALDKTRRPALEYREVMLFDAWEADWMARNRLNSTHLLQERHGGAVLFVPGFYAHTFKDLVPPAQYFAEHPEYFSEVEGRRVGDGGQLCCTNEDVIRIVTDRALQALREHPQARVISVSQNDNLKFCTCARCAALDAKEGSHAAQLLFLVNRVAEAVAAEFPDRAVETLAYEWSLTPPKTIRPRENVIVRLSTIKCSFSEPLETQPRGRAFRGVLEGWSRVSSRLWIWDYTTYFSYYPLPWPNYRVMDDNIRYFLKNNVRGIVEQNNWQSPGSDMAALKGYLLARLLWDPDTDADRATTEFLEGVYGPAAASIRAYLDLLSDKVAAEHIPLTIYGSRTPPYLSRDILEKADLLWEAAVAAVADQPEYLRRVQQARLSHDYAYIEHFRWKPDGRFIYDGQPQRGKVKAVTPAYRRRVERFLEHAGAAGVTHIREGDPDYEEYARWLRGFLTAPELEP